jgi:hypothetical protein
MVASADYGLMIWDGESTSTLANVLALMARGKKSVVWFNPAGEWLTIANPAACAELIGRMSDAARASAQRKIGWMEKLQELQERLPGM